MPQVHRALAIDFLAQGRGEQGAFQVVHGQGVAGQEAVDITPADQGNQGLAGIPVKDHRRPQDPQDKTVFLLKGEQRIKLIVIYGERGLPRPPGEKGKLVRRRQRLSKGLGVNIDAVLAIFAPPQGHLLPHLEVVKFLDHERPIRPQDHHTIHAGILQQDPGTRAQVVILGKIVVAW